MGLEQKHQKLIQSLTEKGVEVNGLSFEGVNCQIFLYRLLQTLDRLTDPNYQKDISTLLVDCPGPNGEGCSTRDFVIYITPDRRNFTLGRVAQADLCQANGDEPLKLS